MPMVPAEQHGKLVIFAILCYAGPVEAGLRAVAPFKAIATPLMDTVKPGRYTDVYPPEDPNYHPIASARTMFIDKVGRATAELIVDRLKAGKAMMNAIQIRVLGGAMARVPVDATAFAHRRSRIMVNVAALYGAPEEASRHEPWVLETVDALRQTDRGVYVNFLVDEGPDQVRAAYPGKTWDRLRDLKRRYDPENLFRVNQNIPPA
jgi:hypothetical protein